MAVATPATPNIDALAGALFDAVAAERKARSALYDAIRRADPGLPDTVLATRAGLDRMTIRKIRGKR